MDLHKLLSELADEIDITESQEGLVKRAYNGVASWLNQNEADIAKHKVHIFPQGSMMYGTAIKPIDENDYDIDLVCEFKENVNNLNPEYVKKSVGARIKENGRYKQMLQAEGRRCWTLKYSDTMNFHMDILPAIPFKEEYYRADSALYTAFSGISMKELALLATDKDKITGRYHYIPTNPRGYAEWFKSKTQINKRRAVYDSIEQVPSYSQKTVLQKAVQLLKRHRDVYFLSRDESYKPISMIITTLLADCYEGEDNLYVYICNALKKMPSLITRGSNGEFIIRNPVMNRENFADKWSETPQKAEAFFSWVNDAYVDFSNLADITTYSEIDKYFKELFSQKPVDRLMKKYESHLRSEKNSLYTNNNNPASVIELEKIPYRKSPPWILPHKYRISIIGEVSYDGKNYQSFDEKDRLPKNVDLRFFPIHSIKTPYSVKWQITNTGIEAEHAGCLRGNIFEDATIKRNGVFCGKNEKTQYTGKHYIQCFILKNGNRCVGVSKPFIVHVK